MSQAILDYNIGDILAPWFAVIISFSIYKQNITNNKRINKILGLLIIEHFLMTVLYYYMSISGDGQFDAVGYYNRGVVNRYYLNNVDFRFGTTALIYIVHYLHKLLGLNYFALYWPFSILGLIGIVRIFNVCSYINHCKWTNFLYLFLLPNLHYWSCAIGKDSIAIYAIGSFIYMIFFRRKVLNCLFAILLFCTIRIHIVALISLAYLITVIIKGKIYSLKYRLAIVFIMLTLAPAIYMGISETLAFQEGQSTNQKVEELEQITAEGGTTVDMRGKSIIIKWTSYLFRPLFFDAKSFLTILASIENTIWLFLFLYFLRSIGLNKYREFMQERISFFYWFSIMGILCISIPNAYIMYNLGLAMRQKYMFFPFVLTLTFIISSYNRSNPSVNNIESAKA